MKAICVCLGLAICLLMVKGDKFSIKYEVVFYSVAKCTNATTEDEIFFGGLVVKCDKEMAKVEEIIHAVNDDKKNNDKLFKKFCNVYPEFYNCAEGALDYLKKCLNPKERIVIDIFGVLQQFMCSENGKQGTVFIAEDGVNCFNTTMGNIRDCINTSAGQFTETSQPICSDLEKISKCVKTNMETCSSKIPANILEAFFKITKEKLQCKN